MNRNERPFDTILCLFESGVQAEAIFEVSVVESRSEKSGMENFGQDNEVALVT
jgi:hypothetical protein